MKEKLTIIQLIMCTLCLTSCTLKHNDVSELKLKGNVKSIKTTSFEITDNFGEIRKISEKKIYSNDEKNIEYSYVAFNETGMIIESLYYTIGAHNEAEIRSFLKYNEKGFISEIREILTVDTKTESITSFIYDEKNNLIEKKSVSDNFKNDNSFNKINYAYDENGNKIEEKYLTVNPRINYTYENIENFKYNKDGCLIEKYNKSNSSVYKYDNSKNLLEEKQYSISDNGDLSFNNIVLYGYDNNNNLIDKSEKGADGTLYSRTKFDYDENGLLSEKKSSNNFGGNYKESFKYELDNEKNWIKKTIFINDKPSQLQEREIVYY